MAHASDMRRAHRLFLGNRKLELVYHGRAAHAAAYPERGINALDGVIALFVAIGLLRQQLPPGVRVHGIVSDGGKAPNIIPERAAARVWVRALDEAVLEDACARVLALRRGRGRRDRHAARAARRGGLVAAACARTSRSPTPIAVSSSGSGSTSRRTRPAESIGSSDITHVSRVVPTIHPNFPIGERPPAPHA